MKSYYEYEFKGENEKLVADLSNLDMWPFFRTVAAEIAMGDCSDATVTKIVYQGTEYKYEGWKPDMEYTFYNVNDPDDAYTTWIPEYDH